MDDAFAPLIDATWRGMFSGQRTLQDDSQLQLACSDDLDEGEDGMLLQPVVGPARALLRPALATRLQLHAQSHWTLPQLQQRLQQLGQRTHGADRVFYFPSAELAALAERPASPHIRRLGPADAVAFDVFQASASEEDLDAAWVELDHWQVFGAFDGERFRADVTSTSRTMLGLTQLLWLQGTLLQATGTWQVLGQQILMGKMSLPAAIATQQMSIPQYAMLGALAKLAARAAANDPTLTVAELQYLQANQALLTPEVIALLQLPSIPYNLDAWDGYAYEREVILGTAKSKNHNLVVIAGDTHNAWANELKDVNGNSVGVEFATSSVSSPGLEYYLNLPVEQIPATEAAIVELVPDLKYTNLKDRGFMTLTFTKEAVRSDWHYVSTILAKEFEESTSRSYSAMTKVGEHIINPVS
ncbi:MAG: hypothetical protein DI592_14775 [Stenotrophomonas maltophilia]|nr:MAG: hypothetical protein DI592_14775 [Stenotrophomonas maltophilia]